MQPATIADLCPKRLDDLIKNRRDLVSLHLSTQEELDLLPLGEQIRETSKSARATINDWRFVCIVRPEDYGGKAHMLTGVHEAENCAWVTSYAKAVDLENGIVTTHSGSLYRLGTKGEGEPPLSILLHICHAFHTWGFGNLLGVLPIFY